MTKLEIIDETVAFYSDVSKRSYDYQTNRCLYKSPNGNECAFQRVVKTDLSKWEGSSAMNIMNNHNIVFKKGYEGHEPNFWNEIQKFHDNNAYWEQGGLTKYGKSQLEYLKKQYT